MSIINAKRLRDYPRLMFITVWVILLFNIILGQGWIGATGQVIGGDFIMFYSTGLVYRSEPDAIFSYDTQQNTQQSLVEPTILPGHNPYMNPPYVAPLYSLLTYLSLPWAMVIWTLLAILSTLLSARWLFNLLPSKLISAGLNNKQLAVIVLSFFPFVEGIQSGQNHWLTLLLVTGIVITTFSEKWYLSGIMAGLLIYKPQFIIGFLILWLIWGNIKSLISFALVAVGWVGLFVLSNGMELFHTYSQLSQVFMLLPYIAGFPKYLLVTFYGLLTSIFPQGVQPILYGLSQILLVCCVGILAWLAFKLRKRPMAERIPALSLALLLPLLATPYALLHDMLILIPGFILWARYSASRSLLIAAIITYLGTFFLTLMAVLTKFAWVSSITIGLFITILIWIYSHRNEVFFRSAGQ